MTEGVLSKQEIDALLNAVSAGRFDAVEDLGPTEADVRKYDLTSRERIIRGRMPTLEVLNERMSRSLRVSFFNYLRKTIVFEEQETQLVKLEEFMGRKQQVCLNLFRLPPLHGMALLAIDRDVVFGLVDQLFGGAGGASVRSESREFSAIELRLIKKTVEIVLKDLAEAWRPVLDVKPEYLRTETNIHFAAITAPADVVVDIGFRIELGPGFSGSIHVVIPYGSIEPIKHLFTTVVNMDERVHDSTWKDSMLEVVGNSVVELCALLGNGNLSVRDLQNLKVGDTIPLDTDPSRPLPIKIQGVEKAWGRGVVSRGRVAIKLVTPVGVEPPRPAPSQTTGEDDEREQTLGSPLGR